MGRGVKNVADEGELGPLPVASISLPFMTQRENWAIAEFFSEAWNKWKHKPA